MTGRFLTEDTHWNTRNMVYGDNPVEWNKRSANQNDLLGLNIYTYKPDVRAVAQSGNLYIYCINNPVTFIDPNGNSITIAVIGGVSISLAQVIATGIGVAVFIDLVFNNGRFTADFVTAVVNMGMGVVDAINYAKTDRATQRAISSLAGFSGSPMPLPPNNPKSTGTNTGGSHKLYEKGKVRIEVENNGSIVGRVHLQIKGNTSKYYYNPQDMKFYTDFGFSQLASNSIQTYLTDIQIINAIIQGLRILGF